MKKGFQLGLCLLLVACGGAAYPSIPISESAKPITTPSVAVRESVTESVSISASVRASVTESISTSVPPSASVRDSVTESVYTSVPPSASVRESVTESVYKPADWKQWPVVPVVDPSIRAIYEYGQTLGNDPRAVSVFGDCQTRPAEFLGVFETNPATLMSLSPELNETFEYFRDSFNRESPTAQDGTTPGALLWTQWHQGDFTCTFAETPVQCELRIQRPSFVIIQVGTHFESRNTEYLRKIILQLLDAGVVPIMATKADNREKDERINRDMALLASEYDLPLWNFWAAVSDLPNRGLYTRDDRPLQGDIYLTAEALRIHRVTALAALNAVWRAVIDK
jgi:hypothetical protein